MNHLEIINVSKKYPGQEQEAVKEVSLSVKEGEVFTLVGESGCGKTTLLRLIKGLEDTDSGEIFFDGAKVTGPSKNLVPGHPRMELVYQNYNLFPKHTVAENIQYVLRNYDKEYQEKRTHELLEVCHLIGYAHKIPAELSGGQQQRIAIAKAIAASPEVLLMDEPFSNLDLVLKNEIKNEVMDFVRGTKATAIFVTHDPADALTMSDRIAVMKSGKVLQVGTPKEIYEQPNSSYVAHFFGNANVLSSEDAKKYLNIKTEANHMVCIRAEKLLLCPLKEALFSGKVTRINYFGPGYQVELKIDGKIKVFFYTRDENIKKGDLLGLRILGHS